MEFLDLCFEFEIMPKNGDNLKVKCRLEWNRGMCEKCRFIGRYRGFGVIFGCSVRV